MVAKEKLIIPEQAKINYNPRVLAVKMEKVNIEVHSASAEFIDDYAK